MSTTKNQTTSFTEDIFTGLGKVVGGVLGEAYDVTAGVVVGIASTPGAIIDGFNDGLFSDEQNDEPKKATAKAEPMPQATLQSKVDQMSPADKAQLLAALNNENSGSFEADKVS